MDSLASLDGVIGPAGDTRIAVTDDGLLRGDGVFEVTRLYGGVPFVLDEHLARLGRSAANLRLDVDLDALRAEAEALVDRVGPVDAALRLVCTRGGRRLAIVESIVAPLEAIALEPVAYAPTRLLDAVKSLSYGANMLATRLAKEAGADEALLHTPHGRVLEAPTSTLFYVLDGRLHSPPLDDHILDSITRRHLFAMLDVTERVTALDEVGAMAEAFLASSIREVQPVRAIAGLELSAGAPGPVTAAAIGAWRDHVAAAVSAATAA